jgi:two-component system, LytTR family, response regulator
MLSAFLLDDEALAVGRLERLLGEDGRLRVAGSATDPVAAIERIEQLRPDVLFLDIQMPELDGFAVLEGLRHQPLVIFVTAYDAYALKAFEVNSIAYLLKPVEPAKLERAIDKLERMHNGGEAAPDLQQIVLQLKRQMSVVESPRYPERISSKVGEKVELIDLSRVTHFFAEEKLTYAATEAKNYIVDLSITELETKLDPQRFARIHRSTIVNLSAVSELYNYFGGKLVMRLKDAKKTELTVAKERARELKERLGL